MEDIESDSYQNNGGDILILQRHYDGITPRTFNGLCCSLHKKNSIASFLGF